MKIAICVPHTGTLRAETAQCLGGMLFFTARAGFTYNGKPARPEVELLFSGAGPLDWKRTNLALQAIKAGSDYLLWIDSDQTFPNDALVRLMMHDKPIIGTNIASRHTGGPTAFDLQGKELPRGSGVEEVSAIGLGFCLMKTPVFEKVPQRWFAMGIDDQGALVCGEDVHFCNRARTAGIRIFVDHDLEIGHIADRTLFLKREGAGVDIALPEAAQ